MKQNKNYFSADIKSKDQHFVQGDCTSLPALKGYANLMNIIATIFGPFDGLQWSKTIDKCMENANSSSV